MIPRVKVNYGLRDLLRALLIREDDAGHKAALLEALRALFERPHVLLTPSGRGGLYYLLKATPRRKVVLPAYTCNALTEAARLAGKEIVYAPMEPGQFNQAPEALEGLIDADSIVIATHQYGVPCQIERFIERAHAAGALVLEDVAAGLGTRIEGRLAGTFGDAAFFSFDLTKLVNVPSKGGFVLVRDAAYFEETRALYDREIEAMPLRRKLDLIGYSAALVTLEAPALYRLFHLLMFQLRGHLTDESNELPEATTPYYDQDLAEWQAAIALPQLRALPEIIARRGAIYRRYHEGLEGCVTFARPPALEEGWACIRFPIQVYGDKVAFYRRCAALGVDVGWSFTRVVAPSRFTRAHEIADSVLCLPFNPKMSDAEVERVIRAIRRVDRALAAPSRDKEPRVNLKSLRVMIHNRLNREEIYSRPEFWDAKATTFKGKAVSMWPNQTLNQLYEEEQQRYLARVLPARLEGWRLLDLGCGTGRMSHYFAERGARVLGIDFAAEAIKIARAETEGDNPEFRVTSLFDLEEEGGFNVAFSWGVLTAAAKSRAEVTDVLRRVYRALEPGGRVVLLEPTHRGFLHRVLDMTAAEFVEALEEVGFELKDLSQLHFWPVRLAVGYFPAPRRLTRVMFKIGERAQGLISGNTGDYKGFYAIKPKA